MTDTDEIAKLVDGAYKNILEKFNPCARHLISAGKAYLKSLHGSVASSKTYLEAISKLARHAHQGTWGGSTDIGTALMQLVEVHKEIHAQQNNILKAFYVDLLLPLESNLEKDTKVVASQHKRFLQQHKCHQESYQKALSLCCKKPKKRMTRNSICTIGKDIKQLQTMEDEKKRLEEFCEDSLKQAITQERRRYGFVLERQCSLAKHYLAYHTKGQAVLQHNLEQWLEIVKTREHLPESIEKMFAAENSINDSEYASSTILTSPMSAYCLNDGYYTRQGNSCCTSPTLGMRKTQSIDASYLDLRDYDDGPYHPRPLSRAKSDFNLTISSSSTSLTTSSDYGSSFRQKATVGRQSLKSSDREDNVRVKAVYSYLSSGEHQLSFHEGDVITLIGDRNKGWQYGENLRNHRVGWFPIAYTEPILDDTESDDQSSEQTCWCSHAEFRRRPKGFDTNGGPKAFSSYALSSLASAPHSEDDDFFPKGEKIRNRPHSTFHDNSILTTKDTIKVTPVKIKQALPRTPSHFPSTFAAPPKLLHHHPPLKELQETPQIFRSPRRSLTAPFPISVPPPNLPSSSAASHHSSNDSGFCNDSQGPQPSPTPSSKAGSSSDGPLDEEELLEKQEEEDQNQIEERERENVFASVKLKKVITNDRSAPILS